MKRLTKTQYGVFQTEYVGYRGSTSYKHWRFYSSCSDSKTPFIQCYGKTKKQAILQFECLCANGFFDY